jgi:hypothetical protein
MLRFIPPFWSGHNKAGKRTAGAPLKKSVHTAFSAPTFTRTPRHPIPEVANRLLRKAVAFDDSDRAASVSRFRGEVRIEWRNLSIRRISEAPLSEVDRFKGITQRSYVHLACDAHRRRDAKTGHWSGWENNGYALFPSVIVVELINGSYIARAEGLETFAPAALETEPLVEFPLPLLATA